MIIRRRHTKSFVTLENQLVRDRRLSLDEHGMLHYLLSLPDDWEVSRANCAKFWDIGRDKAARIFRALRKFGWAQVERVHAEDGTFLGVRWIITDEPGQEVPDEVLDQETSEKEMPGRAVVPEESDHDTENPSYGLPVVRVTRDTDKAYHGLYIDSKKTDSEENRIPQNGAREKSIGEGEAAPPTFADLAKQWPPDHILSRIAAEQAWHRLGRIEKCKAVDVADRYLADCRSNSRKVCDLTTYLREERFERFASGLRSSGTKHLAKPNSPQWYRWRDYLKATGKSVTFMEAQAAKGTGWSTPTEWPPASPKIEGAPSADGTGPPTMPGTMMTEQDMANI